MILPSGCSEAAAVTPEVSAVSMDPVLMLEKQLRFLDLDFDVNPSFIARKNELSFELALAVKPDVEELVLLGKDKLNKYNISPDQISDDPNDPRFALVGMLIDQLELAYANGYVLEFHDPPVPDEGMSGVGQCAMDAAGLSGFVHLVQSGVSGAGLNGAVVLRTFGRITVRGALGWIGAGWVAWEFGSCIAKIPAMSVPYEDLTQTQKSERMKFLMKNLQHVRDDFLNAAGDTAVLILYEANPFKEL
jgi:hypothetical protein